MVLNRSPQVKAVIAVAVAFSLLSSLPPTTGHDWYGIEFGTPNEGMAVELDHYGNITFEGVGRQLAGHHEWRDVALVSLQYGYSDRFAYDLETGHLIGQGYGFSDRAAVLDLPLLREALSNEYSIDWTHNHPNIYATILPESLLWGRTVYPGDSWSVPTTGAWCPETTVDVHVDGTSTNGTWADVVATITFSCWFDDGSWREVYTLGFDDPESPIASDRTVDFVYASGNDTWSYPYAVPATVHAGDGDPLPFEGRSHARFWAPRDQTLHYAPVGIFPEDPDPHPLFDVTEAGNHALALEDETVRLFLARAEEVHLFDARLYLVSVYAGLGQRLYWSFEFLDDKGIVLWVSLEGIQVAGNLIVLDHHTDSFSLGWEPAPPGAMEVAAPGDLARTSDRFLDAHGWQATSYRISLYAPWASYGVGYVQDLPHPIDQVNGWIQVDATTGIVSGHGSFEYGITADPQALLP